MTGHDSAVSERAGEIQSLTNRPSKPHPGRVYITLIIRLSLWGLAGCPGERQPPDAGPAIVDSGAASVDSGSVVDAGPPGPKDLPLTLTAVRVDGGLEVVTTEADSTKHLSAFIAAPLTDYRLRVFDEADKVVPSDDVAHEADGGIDYQISFVDPLKPGKTYRLMVEAQLGSQLDGFKDAEVSFKVRGQSQPEPKSAKPGKKKRR